MMMLSSPAQRMGLLHKSPTPSLFTNSPPQQPVRLPIRPLASWGGKQQSQRGGGVGSKGSQPRAAASSTEPATSFRIIIQGRNVTVTPAIKEHLETKLISAVSSFEAVIKEVVMMIGVHRVDKAPHTTNPHQSTD